MTEPGLAARHQAPFDYALWTEILAAIVTREGKVDYEILARHRDLLTRFVIRLGMASPDTTPRAFPLPSTPWHTGSTPTTPSCSPRSLRNIRSARCGRSATASSSPSRVTSPGVFP